MHKFLRALTPLVYLIDDLYQRTHYTFCKKLYQNLNHISGETTSSGKVLVFLVVGFRLKKIAFISMIKYFNNHGYKIIILINGKYKKNDLKNTEDLIKDGLIHAVYARNNYGYDFGAYKYLFKEIYSDNLDEICFLNDSVYFPACNPGKFFAWLEKKRSFGGSLINYGDKIPHIQSFFMQFKGKVGISFLNDFLTAYLPLNSRVHAINKGEIQLTKLAIKLDIDQDIFFDIDNIKNLYITEDKTSCMNTVSKFINTNTTHTLSNNLLKSGYPFLKWDIFKKRIQAENILILKIEDIPTIEDKDKFFTFLKYNLLNKPSGLIYRFLSIYGLK